MNIPNDTFDLILPDLTATEELGKNLASALAAGAVIYLHGDLGAGKTTIVRSALVALGYTGVAKSPTYTLIEFYPLNDFTLNHFDLYRLNDPSELDYIGLRDYITSDSVSIFEWPSKGTGHIPNPDLEIFLQFDGAGRVANIQAGSALGQKMLHSIKAGQ